METKQHSINQITKRIINAAYEVGNTLGYGFLEKVYENAMVHELSKRGMKVETQKSVQVIYDGIIMGSYTLDLLVEDSVVIELKSVQELCKAHFSQSLNYLKATNLNICLLINFGLSVEVKRIINGFF